MPKPYSPPCWAKQYQRQGADPLRALPGRTRRTGRSANRARRGQKRRTQGRTGGGQSADHLSQASRRLARRRRPQKHAWRKTRRTTRPSTNWRSSNWPANNTTPHWTGCSSCLFVTATTAKACRTRPCCKCSTCWATITRWSPPTAANCLPPCINPARSSCRAAYPRRSPP